MQLRNKDYSFPIIFAGVPTSSERDEVVTRVRNIRRGTDGCDGWCFDIRLQEPSCKSHTAHAAENVDYLVVDTGVYYTDEGAMFQAGTVIAAGRDSFTDVDFHNPFRTPPPSLNYRY